MKKISRLLTFIVAFVIVLAQAVPASAFQTINEQYPLSSGVMYNNYTYKGSNTNSINHLSVNLNDAHTKVTLGMPDPIASRLRTTVLATRNSVEGNRVVGAVNGGFFNMAEGNPLFLIAQNNRIINGGVVSVGADEYVNVPTAFGMKENGEAIIDYFDFDINLTANGKTYELSGMNRERNNKEVIVFTPEFYKAGTNSNQYGYEIIVDAGTSTRNIHFGDTISGKVTQVLPYGQNVSKIPENGFVISVQGGSPLNADMQKLTPGTDVSVNFSIDSKWNNAQFIVASGPMLVRDGKRYLMISESSPRAKEVTARTVVGISKDKKTVHFITVDGKQSRSPGMNMSQLADYLISLGVDTAINLDGGGSTTMGIRKYGSNNVVLANIPSAGSERAVNSILQAVSTAPTSEAATIKYTRTNVGTMLVGTTSTISVQYVLDQYYNPLAIANGTMSFSSQNGTLRVSGYSFTTTQAGDDRIYMAHNGKVIQSFPVKVVDGPSKLTINGSSTLDMKQSAAYKITALDAEGKQLVYNADQVKWSVEGGIGSISSSGQFTATKEGQGRIVAQLGTTTASIPVTVKAAGLFKDIPADYVYAKEVKFLVDNGYVTGYGDGTFRPNQTLSRAHAAVIISRVLGLNTANVKDPGFKDVTPSHTYYKEIAAVQNAGIISGVNGAYNPNNNLTRAQMAKIVAKAFELEGVSNIEFKDVPKTSWEYEFVQALAANNITTGYGGNLFKPNEFITRMHFGLFLYRALN
ncbi:MAG: S-layer homology domain-containing protein [Lysinibacillus sp.]